MWVGRGITHVELSDTGFGPDRVHRSAADLPERIGMEEAPQRLTRRLEQLPPNDLPCRVDSNARVRALQRPHDRIRDDGPRVVFQAPECRRARGRGRFPVQENSTSASISTGSVVPWKISAAAAAISKSSRA